MKDIALERREGIKRKEGIRRKIRRRGGRGTNTGDLNTLGKIVSVVKLYIFQGERQGAGKDKGEGAATEICD